MEAWSQPEHPSLGEKSCFHIALREDARHAPGFQTQSIGHGGEKAGFRKLRLDVLFLVCVDRTNNDSQTVQAKDATETDIGQAQSETLSPLSAYSELYAKERGVVKLCAKYSIYLAYVLASFMSM